MDFEALVFDFDGLIFDSEMPDFVSWRETYAEFGVELPLDVWQQNIGAVDLFDPYAYLAARLERPLDRAAVLARRKARDSALLAQQTLMPGVVETLEAARGLGLRLAVASSSRHDWVDPLLARLGLNGRFDAVCCRDDVGDRGKPDPAVYRAALAALDVAPRRAVALEDSPNGAAAALAAGLWCVVVPNEMTRPLAFPGVHDRLDALPGAALPRLLAALPA